MISEIFFLTCSGETLLRKRYKNDIPKSSIDIFHGKIKETKTAPLLPCMKADGISFFHIKKNSIFIVASCKEDILPITVIELLTRIYNICKDFCGVINEESIRVNLILLYEILDEVLDFGYVQLCSTDKLKPYIQGEPVLVRSKDSVQALSPGLFGIEHRTAPNTAADKPVIRSKTDQELRKNEVFVDVIERISALVHSNGDVLRCDVSGQINMKCFLIGSPVIKLGLNEDIMIKSEEKQQMYGNQIQLSDCHFHKSVKLDEFNSNRILTVLPPDGEFTVLTYHLSGTPPHGLPFRLFSFIDNNSASSRDCGVHLKLRCEIPPSGQAVKVKVTIPVPKATTGISQQLSGPGQRAEFNADHKQIIWSANKVTGGSEISAKFKLISPNQMMSSTLDLGPVALDCELSSFISSGLQIRFLRVFDRDQSYVPYRWIRYLTVTDSYVFKL